MRTLMAVGLSAFLAATPVAAQQHMGHMQHGQARMGMMGQQGHMGMYGAMGMGSAMGPGMILSLAEPLGLSEDQVDRIQTIRDDAMPAMQTQMQQAMERATAAATLLEGATTDVDAYAAALREAADHAVQARVAMARAWVQARQVLTPEQRDRLGTGIEMMTNMMRSGMMGPGMMYGGMMGSGMMGPGMMHGRGMWATPDTTP